MRPGLSITLNFSRQLAGWRAHLVQDLKFKILLAGLLGIRRGRKFEENLRGQGREMITDRVPLLEEPSTEGCGCAYYRASLAREQDKNLTDLRRWGDRGTGRRSDGAMGRRRGREVRRSLVPHLSVPPSLRRPIAPSPRRLIAPSSALRYTPPEARLALAAEERAHLAVGGGVKGAHLLR